MENVIEQYILVRRLITVIIGNTAGQQSTVYTVITYESIVATSTC